MNREDIIRMAREAGIDAERDTLCRYEGFVEPLERFAALVAKHTLANIDPSSFMSWQEGFEDGAAAEREACAKVCIEQADDWRAQLDRNYVDACSDCAAAIRARGETE